MDRCWSHRCRVRVVRMRRLRKRWEIIRPGFVWPTIVFMVVSRNWRCFWGATGWHINQESFFNCLASGKVCIQGPAHGLVWLKLADGLVFWHNLYRKIGRIELTTQGIGIFPQDHVANIINQIIFIDGDHGSRGAGALDPYLSGDHVRTDGS